MADTKASAGDRIITVLKEAHDLGLDARISIEGGTVIVGINGFYRFIEDKDTFGDNLADAIAELERRLKFERSVKVS